MNIFIRDNRRTHKGRPRLASQRQGTPSASSLSATGATLPAGSRKSRESCKWSSSTYAFALCMMIELHACERNRTNLSLHSEHACTSHMTLGSRTQPRCIFVYVIAITRCCGSDDMHPAWAILQKVFWCMFSHHLIFHHVFFLFELSLEIHIPNTTAVHNTHTLAHAACVVWNTQGCSCG